MKSINQSISFIELKIRVVPADTAATGTNDIDERLENRPIVVNDRAPLYPQSLCTKLALFLLTANVTAYYFRE